MNFSEMATRLSVLELQVKQLFESDSIWNPTKGYFKLNEMTTAQRTALGLKLTTAEVTVPIVVYDTEDQTFYAWNGSQWV